MKDGGLKAALASYVKRIAAIRASGVHMLRIHFTADDYVRTTLAAAPDPLWEVLLSLHQLQGADGRAQYGAWRERIRRQLPRELTWLLRLAPPTGYSPDFLTPHSGSASFDEALDSVLSTSPHRVRAELDILATRLPTTIGVGQLAGSGRRAMNELGEAIRSYHRLAIAPYWQSIRNQVRADHQSRLHQFTGAGLEYLLAHLHPRIQWEAPMLKVLDLAEGDLRLDGRGLRLQPSFFCWDAPTKLRNPELSPVLVYPIQHVPGALRPNDGGRAPQSLPTLLGRTRAAVLEATRDGCTTTELARRCRISLAGASHQASILRGAGLITTRRAGTSVRHELTALGLAMLGEGPIEAAHSVSVPPGRRPGPMTHSRGGVNRYSRPDCHR
jgi:DNA-binding transcriptional ArsR family regulator